MKKLFASLALSIAFVLTIISGSVLADFKGHWAMPNGSLPFSPEEKSSITHITRMTALKLESGKSDSNESEGWSWDAENKILRLDNVTIITDDFLALHMPSGTIVLTGNNTLTSICQNNDDGGFTGNGVYGKVTAGIYCSGSLRIEGDGDLTVSGGTCRMGGYGIHSGGKLSISIGGKLTAKGGNGYASSDGIDAGGDITINSGTITAQGGTALSFSSANGISTHFGYYSIIINGGTIVANGGTSQSKVSGSSYGLYARDLIVNGGNVTAQCGSCVLEDKESAIRCERNSNPLTLGPGVSFIEPSEWSVESLCHGSDIKTAVIQGADYSTVPPQSPSIALSSVTINSHQVPTVVWEPVEGAAYYAITIQDTGDGHYIYLDQLMDASITSMLLDLNEFVKGTVYQISVKAVDRNMNFSEPSNVIEWKYKTDPAEMAMNQPGVSIKQTKGSPYCTYTAVANLMRRYAVEQGIPGWDIWNDILIRTINNASLSWKNHYVNSTGDYTIYTNSFRPKLNGITDEELKNYYIDLLGKYPEGIIIYNEKSLWSGTYQSGSKTETIHDLQHAVVLTDYDEATDTFYCVDSGNGVPSGRIALGNSSMLFKYTSTGLKTDFEDYLGKQLVILRLIDRICYVEGSEKAKELESSSVKTDCPVEMRITCNGSSLDSRELAGTQSTVWGTMTATGDGDDRTVEVTFREGSAKSYDIQIELFGTGSGTMDLVISHQFMDGTKETDLFSGVPVSASTRGSVQSIFPQCGVTLKVEDTAGEEAAYWVAQPGETVSRPSTDVEPETAEDLDSDDGSGESESNKVYFDDVPADSWYRDALNYVLKNAAGVINGTDATHFSPNDKLTRAAFAKILWAIEGSVPAKATNSFTDVKTGDWYYDAVIWANAKAIMLGSDNLCKPNNNITREEMAVMIQRWKDKDGKVTAVSTFADTKDIHNWAVDAVAWAAEQGYIKGKDDGSKFAPLDSLTRAEMIMVVARTLGYKG